MIDINNLFKTGVNVLSDNAPALLTAFGAVGAVTTAVLTGKASFEAAHKIVEAEVGRSLEKTGQADNHFPLTNTEKVKLVWPLYISAVSSGVLTCGAIVMAHRVSSRRAAVIAAAYALNEGKLEEYQEKVKEKFGVKKEKELRDDLVADAVERDYDEGTVIFSPLDGKVLIRDDYSGRFFYGTIEEVNRAVNEVNHQIIMDDSVTLSEFYGRIGLESVSTSDYFGWNTSERCEIDWSTTTTPDGATPVHSFAFVNPPIMNPGRNDSFR